MKRWVWVCCEDAERLIYISIDTFHLVRVMSLWVGLAANLNCKIIFKIDQHGVCNQSEIVINNQTCSLKKVPWWSASICSFLVLFFYCATWSTLVCLFGTWEDGLSTPHNPHIAFSQRASLRGWREARSTRRLTWFLNRSTKLWRFQAARPTSLGLAETTAWAAGLALWVWCVLTPVASAFCKLPQWREDRTPERSANIVQLLVVSQSFLFFFLLLNQALLSEWCYETKVPTVTFKKGKNACWLPPCMTSWPGRLLEPGHMLLSVLSVLLNKVFSRVAPAGLHRLRVAFPDKLMKSTK